VRRALLLLVLLAACNRDDSPVISADGTTSTSVSPTTTAAPTSLPVRAPAGSTRAYLKDVHVAGHDGYDRVTFEFEDAAPGYEVTVAQRPVAEDGSGDPVEVEGVGLLQVRFENAAGARIEGERVVEVYRGPGRVPSGSAELVAEAVDVGDFEGTVTWVIGLRQTVAAARVSVLTDPHRVVVDIPTA
jgi:Asp-tRNA(Asn)/Glu-tRNA(Gln) amidotransferase B subunit